MRPAATSGRRDPDCRAHVDSLPPGCHDATEFASRARNAAGACGTTRRAEPSRNASYNRCNLDRRGRRRSHQAGSSPSASPRACSLRVRARRGLHECLADLDGHLHDQRQSGDCRSPSVVTGRLRAVSLLLRLRRETHHARGLAQSTRTHGRSRCAVAEHSEYNDA
jgi:hypothetical protein